MTTWCSAAREHPGRALGVGADAARPGRAPLGAPRRRRPPGRGLPRGGAARRRLTRAGAPGAPSTRPHGRADGGVRRRGAAGASGRLGVVRRHLARREGHDLGVERPPGNPADTAAAAAPAVAMLGAEGLGAASGPSSRASRMMRRGSYWRGSSFCQSTSSNSGPISSRMRVLAPLAMSRTVRTSWAELRGVAGQAFGTEQEDRDHTDDEQLVERQTEHGHACRLTGDDLGDTP